MQYKTTTPSKMPHDTEAIFDYICTHKPVVIESSVRHDIIMVLATDYYDLNHEIESLKRDLKTLGDDFEKIEYELKMLKDNY